MGPLLHLKESWIGETSIKMQVAWSLGTQRIGFLLAVSQSQCMFELFKWVIYHRLLVPPWQPFFLPSESSYHVWRRISSNYFIASLMNLSSIVGRPPERTFRWPPLGVPIQVQSVTSAAPPIGVWVQGWDWTNYDDVEIARNSSHPVRTACSQADQGGELLIAHMIVMT